MRYHPFVSCLTALLAAAVLLTGCAAEEPAKTEPAQETAETVIVYQALPLPDLFVKIPETYETTSSEFYKEYYVKDDASIIITEDTEPETLSIKDYSIRALVQYQQMTKTLEVKGDDVVNSDTLAVQLLEFDYTLTEGADPISTMVGFACDRDTVYIVTCKCAKENYDLHREEFLTVMRSLRVDKTGMP